jgi:hypothetical protein
MSDTDPNNEAVRLPSEGDPNPSTAEVEKVKQPRWWRRHLSVLVSWAVVLVLLVVGAGGYFYLQQGTPNTPSQRTNQTEAIFLQRVETSGESNDVLREWRAAREDHKRIAIAIANCDGIADVDTMPRSVFSILLLDLSPSGQHQFPPISASYVASTTSDSNAPGKAAVVSVKDEMAIQTDVRISLVGYQPAMLTLSDAIARARIDAARAAHAALPGVTWLGYTAIFFTALTTLLVSLKPLFGGRTATQVLTVATLLVSVSSTALTSIKTIYDPSQAYSANQQALTKLRALHREVAIVLSSSYVPGGCGQDAGGHASPVAESTSTQTDPTPRDKLAAWVKGLQDIEGAIAPATVVAPNSPSPQTPPAPALGAAPTPAAAAPANGPQRPNR